MKDSYDFSNGVIGKYADGNPANYVSIAVRVFVDGKRITEERLVAPERELDVLIGEVANRHTKLIMETASRMFMVEFEFLDLPPTERFLRFGTDPRCMVQPMAINLDDMKVDE